MKNIVFLLGLFGIIASGMPDSLGLESENCGFLTKVAIHNKAEPDIDGNYQLSIEFTDRKGKKVQIDYINTQSDMTKPSIAAFSGSLSKWTCIKLDRRASGLKLTDFSVSAETLRNNFEYQTIALENNILKTQLAQCKGKF